MQRVSQELLWDVVLDTIEREGGSVAKSNGSAGGSLTLDPLLPLPRYAVGVDIHCMPGGYGQDRGEGDIAAGALYDRGVHLYAMGYLGPLNDDMGRSVCNYLRRHHPGFRPKRIIDLGCTVGHSTLPYKDAFPDAEVWGIDVAGPQVKYAQLRASALGRDLHFAQMNAERTSFPDGHFDLVVSHILLHETSGRAMPRIFAESHRLLAPGGLMIHADLPPFDLMDPFTQFILDNETFYNNEPFWSTMHELDIDGFMIEAGFDRANLIHGGVTAVVDRDVFPDAADDEGEDYGRKAAWHVIGARK
jgi:SAM-dependent methyltransferase